MESIAPPFRIAFCIECHKYTPVLQTLVDLLDHPGNELYIHIDAKACIRDFEPLRGKVHFIHPRIKVYWGHISQIKCMLRLFEATRKSDCRYIVLLSGDTLPLRSNDEIRRYLAEQYAHKAELVPSEPNEPKITERMRKMHYIKYREKHTFLWRMNRSSTRRFCPTKNPLFDQLPPMETGSNWIAFSDRFRDFIFEYLDEHPHFLPAFRHSVAADEIFFQTILLNSPFAAHNTRREVMYVDWSGENPPRIFGDRDLQQLAEQCRGREEFFARKFDDKLDIAAYRRTILNEQ